MKTYTSLLTQTPQSLPVPGQPMRPNRAGGHGYEVDDKTLARRGMILGTVQGSYYADARELTTSWVTCLDRLLEDGLGPWLVDEIVDISTQGRAPRQEPAILALATALMTAPDAQTRRRAADAAQKVCRTVSTAASLAEAMRAFRPPPATEGRDRIKPAITGPAKRRAFAGCFEAWAQNPDRLAYQLVKYRQRGTWRARDLALLSHYTSADPQVNDILSWLYGKPVENLHPQIAAFEEVKRVVNAGGDGAAARIVELIHQHRLPWECIPTEYSGRPEIQAALFEYMPVTATIRQLGVLTAAGVFEDRERLQMAVERLTDADRVRRARVHPMWVYLNAKVYAQGHGDEGRKHWRPVPEIKAALDEMFLLAVRTAEPTGAKLVVGVDCSGSMVQHDGVGGIPGFRPAEAAFLMAWITARTEPNAVVVAFDDGIREIDLRGVQTLAQLNALAMRTMQQMGGATDCSLPMQHAEEHYGDVDGFAVFTDEETWRGNIHPIEALGRYRVRWERPAAKLVSVGFVAHDYSLVNPVTHRAAEDDPGTLAVIGFDKDAPAVIRDFLRRGTWLN